VRRIARKERCRQRRETEKPRSGRRTDLFDGNNLLRLVVHGLVHGAETPCAELLHESILTGRITARHWIRFSGGSQLGFGRGWRTHGFGLWRNGSVNGWTLLQT
jgi:hypothetical protein